MSIRARSSTPTQRGYSLDDSQSVALSTASALTRQDSFQGFSSRKSATKSALSPDRRSASAPRQRTNPTRLSVDSSFTSNASYQTGRTSYNQNTTNNPIQTAPSNKSGRVKVGIRCRPAFQDEIEFAKGNFFSIVNCRDTFDSADSNSNSNTGQVTLTLINGKQRDFKYDYAFNPTVSQDTVFSKIAQPVITEVLNGYNGTIFAYGQTGTGKTYTMGILDFVNSEHAGIIPRALSQIFNFVSSSTTVDVTVTLSFLQIYRESIQDLLCPSQNDENLLIREDPYKGFYVEGLQEFVVATYNEAEALLNLGRYPYPNPIPHTSQITYL